MEALDFDDNRRQAVTIAVIVMLILSCITVSARVWSRLLPSNQGWWWDDWIAFATLVSMTTCDLMDDKTLCLESDQEISSL